MTSKHTWWAVGLLAAGAWGLSAAAPGPVSAEDAGPRVFKEDDGPAEIDVSEYPEEMQKLYKKFAAKCSKCHTLARPINSKFATFEEWDAYVHKMSKKRRSGIRKRDVAAIVKFLTYDSSIRKKELLEQKAKMAAANKAEDEPDSSLKEASDPGMEEADQASKDESPAEEASAPAAP